MTLRNLLQKIAPDVQVWIIKDGCTDLATFKHMPGSEALKEYQASNVEVKNFRFDNNNLFITI